MIEALLDDFSPFAIEENERLGRVRRIHFAIADDRDGAARTIDRYFGSSGVTTAPLEVDDDGWAERSQAALRTVRIGDFVISPPWDIPSRRPGDTLVVIRPSMGFGTGHHASTRSCLRALLATPVGSQSVMDVGTGSGVLAIAATKQGAATVVAIDNDPDALASARDNVAVNGVSFIVTLGQRDFRNLSPDDGGPASIVLANLSGAVLRDYAATLLKEVAVGGTLIVGGITSDEESGGRRAFAPGGMLVRSTRDEEWVALTFHRALGKYP